MAPKKPSKKELEAQAEAQVIIEARLVQEAAEEDAAIARVLIEDTLVRKAREEDAEYEAWLKARAEAEAAALEAAQAAARLSIEKRMVSEARTRDAEEDARREAARAAQEAADRQALADALADDALEHCCTVLTNNWSRIEPLYTHWGEQRITPTVLQTGLAQIGLRVPLEPLARLFGTIDVSRRVELRLLHVLLRVGGFAESRRVATAAGAATLPLLPAYAPPPWAHPPPARPDPKWFTRPPPLRRAPLGAGYSRCSVAGPSVAPHHREAPASASIAPSAAPAHSRYGSTAMALPGMVRALPSRPPSAFWAARRDMRLSMAWPAQSTPVSIATASHMRKPSSTQRIRPQSAAVVPWASLGMGSGAGVADVAATTRPSSAPAPQHRAAHRRHAPPPPRASLTPAMQMELDAVVVGGREADFANWVDSNYSSEGQL